MRAENQAGRRKGPGIIQTAANFSGMGAAIAAAIEQQRKAEGPPKPPELAETEPEKQEELSLGELNPLINPIDFGSGRVIEGLKRTSLNLIEKHGGISPIKIGAELVISTTDDKKIEPRFIARFEVPELSPKQMTLLEKLTRDSNKGVNVRTRKTADGRDISPDSYPPVDKHQASKSRTGGWYMGPGGMPTDALHQGLFVYKDFGEVNDDNFFEKETTATRYIVEIRQGKLYQTDLVELVTQVGSILGKGRMLPHGDLLYEIYYDLMRGGLKDFDPASIYGMEDAIDRIKRGLIYPLANPDLSHGIKQDAESVLLTGVPGTGKTLIAQQLLSEDTGLLILPINAIDLFRELTTEPEKQTLFKRIASVASSTGRKVVLHIDDIENVTQEQEKTQSSLLNLMAGVTDNGFHIIASTNEPERIGTALLQPQRFGIVIHTGLQTEEARSRILNIHATNKSIKEESPLFESDEERNIILSEIARRTDGFTPRYLGEIATVAKSYLLERVARKRRKPIGLKESDLGGEKFTLEDWARALADVSKGYDKKGTVDRDVQIRSFVEHIRVELGFQLAKGVVFDESWNSVREQLEVIRNEVPKQASTDNDDPVWEEVRHAQKKWDTKYDDSEWDQIRRRNDF